MPKRSPLQQLVHPPLRADGRRNYEALLAAADQLFTSDGPDAPLDAIARRAGVSNATLYRHFPDRRDLLVAVCVREIDALCTVGEQLLADPDGGGAFRRWLRTYVEHLQTKHGLAAAFATGRKADSALIAACRAPVRAIGASLLTKAIHQRAVRPDVTLENITILLNAVATATQDLEKRPQTDALMAIVVNGISQPPDI